MDINTLHRTLIVAITEGGPHDATVTFGDLTLIADKMASWLTANLPEKDPFAEYEGLLDDESEDDAIKRLADALVEQTDRNNRLVGEIADLQAQLRAHRWQTYRAAMLALGRMLLESDMGDPLVNAAYAYEIAAEMANLDGDPVWVQLAADCQARG